jgi:hypothetical protein
MLRVIIALLLFLLAPSGRTEQAHCLAVKAHALASERKQGGNEAYALKMLGGSVAQGKFTWLGGTGKFKIIKGSATYTCKFTPKGGHCDWEGEPEM